MREGQRRHLDISLESLINGNRNILGGEKIRQSDQQIHVKVLIQGTKSMPAVYLRSKLVPHGLLWSSKDQHRLYSVPTLDAVTLDLSRNYLLRYKLTHIMEEIIRTDAAKTPLRQRTPEYFVRKYLEHYAYPNNARRRRLIFTESDPNVDSNGNTRIPRHLRSVHKTEIFSLFASQAEWIYAYQCAKPKPRRVIDIKSWGEFIPTVNKARKNAAREGILWGWPIGGEPQLDEINEETSESDEAESSDIADRVRIIGKDAATMRRAIRNAKKASFKGKEPMTRALSRSPTPSSGDEPDPLQMHHYDTDFSESSTESASLSSSDEDSRYDIDPRIYDKVPLPLFRKPDPPRRDMRWWCPVRDCSYLIDMRNLTEENVGNLRGDIVLHLTSGNWRNFYEDRKVFYGFIDMVNSHYNDHLLKLGLKWTDAVDKEVNLSNND
ncbi:hypothetical protein SERLADRAFT_471165 [Serpula lacrymans var. lacrymans S7.9]|uniref:Uncharacterized protein n=1 Tax=Serpula lacrymans var. lacrymans (strain S7.9) TaxID=578457 RepID=F8P0T4_SERL9|nr:uncharacterized protein SERLADRAFT_471165 [Serpula lacrymans var. lacrymans S7.9]EGO22768.1 hypothetical protein SERLADRAFT_471165 [Serpula lacrymans var. lacrymans S7.9]